MVNEAAHASLDRALALVDEALAQAESGEWERVAELDTRCREASRTITEQLRGSDPRSLLQGLRQLRDRHHRLLELAEAHRDRLAQARRDSRRGRQGARAYEDNT